MSEQDFAAEDFEWPEVSELRPADAARLLDDIQRAATAANKRADAHKRRKAQAQAVVQAVAEDYELSAIDFINSDGRRVRFTPSPFDAFSITDEEAFKTWAAGEAERYFTPKLREDIFRDEMRRRVHDGEPLPPGVQRYTDSKLKRTTVAKG